ncbi:MAG: hypothetical protein ABII81_03165 [Pseudomonadota bacterium]
MNGQVAGVEVGWLELPAKRERNLVAKALTGSKRFAGSQQVANKQWNKPSVCVIWLLAKMVKGIFGLGNISEFSTPNIKPENVAICVGQECVAES